ncbi:MAG TPA: AraC family transcriptional regulator [Actinomycetota bacterium]|nr:AraC family transcriptional regulator [Actinomycetota bacterium]
MKIDPASPGLVGPAVADYPPGSRLPWRVIADWELLWMVRGWAGLTSPEGEWSLEPGQLTLLPPGVRHTIAWDPERPSRHGYVHFGAALLDGREIGAIRTRRMTDRDPLAGLCAFLLWLGSERPNEWDREAERTVRFLLRVFTSDALPGDAWAEVMPSPVDAAAAHLRREWSEPPLRRVTVGELAAAAGVSRSYLTRRFRSELGMGVADGLEAARTSRVEALLLRTDLTIESIARQCGFADQFHLSHRFARRYGMSPGRFRRMGSPAPSVLDDDGVRRLVNAVWGT